jgi:enamine deaminase RidA (YjgF/YER057c/UK114 family)
VLQEAGAGPEHMVRMTWYILDRVEYNARLKELGQVYREVMGRNFPAMTCVQVARWSSAGQGRDRGHRGEPTLCFSQMSNCF